MKYELNLRIRLPRKTQRRCRSALHRRARSEPPKSQRATTRSNLFSAQQTDQAVKSYDINTEPRECTPDLPSLKIPADVLKQANGEDEPPVYSDLSAREPDSLAQQLPDKESARSTARRSSATDMDTYKVRESEGEQSSRRSIAEVKSNRSNEDGSGSARRSSRSARSSGKESSRSKESSRKSNKESSRSARPTSARSNNSGRSNTSGKKSERSSARNSEYGSARSSGRSNATVSMRRLSKEPSVAEEPDEEHEIPSPPQVSQIEHIDEGEDSSIKSSLPVPAVRKKSLNYKRSPICD